MSDLFADLPLPGLSTASEVQLSVNSRLPSVPFISEGDTADDVGARAGVGGSSSGIDEGEVAGILAGLNPPQQEAVTHDQGPLLVMAGAGSGKTRVLTRRIAYLLATKQAWASQILAITFTNKAAAEMRERVRALVGDEASRMWVMTFHSACVRILRAEHKAAGLRSTFSIYDAADVNRLVTQICKAQDVDTKRFSVKMISNRISDAKNELLDAADYSAQASHDPVSRTVAEVYGAYQQQMNANHALDFDDLIMRTVHLLDAFPDVAAKYRRRFRHVLVDEYQDTNPAQYALVRLLAGVGVTSADLGGLPPAQLTVVGDSDQSIYAFRGATIRNIEEFEQDFPGARTVYLEQNYRSSGNILAAANAVISKSASRRKKNLWTEDTDGEHVVLYAADTDNDEARWVISQVDAQVNEGRNYGDIAVFYRTNAQSRALEEIMIRSGVPYRVVGGTKFYERREIKDIVAYLKAVANPDDDVNLGRILNVPRRGLGDKAQAALLAHAQRTGTSMGVALGDVEDVDGLAARAAKSAKGLGTLLQHVREADIAGQPMDALVDIILEESGYLTQLRASQDPQDAVRLENLAEFHAVAADFSAAEPAGRLGDFLERISLVADSDQIPDAQDVADAQAQAAGELFATSRATGQVTLMTVHTAKGLEFPVVFVTGLEDGTFPHQRSLAEPEQLEEERRLAYVAITRAREKLFLTRAGSRSQWGAQMDFMPSRFLADIPEDVLDVQREFATRENYSRYSSPVAASGSGYGGSGGYSGGRGYSGYGGSGGSARAGSHTRPTGGKSSVLAGGTLSSASALGKPEKKKPQEREPIALALGDLVTHDIYGEGTVVGVEGSGPNASAKIKFKQAGTKRLLLKFAPLTKLG
ncbi:MAG: UvrD-helicase domain-containing protein [Actinomycetaceae bacterium]|nr:UvrD-helicase domain-containing protein [Actinomycetaceae bacterium]